MVLPSDILVMEEQEFYLAESQDRVKSCACLENITMLGPEVIIYLTATIAAGRRPNRVSHPV